MPHAIGDSFYIFVLLRNLLRRGDNLTLIGGIIHPLRDWFPFARFVPDPTAATAAATFARFDRVIEMFPRTIDNERVVGPNFFSLIERPGFKQRGHILQSMQAIARDDFGLTGELLTESGIQPPPHLVRARFAKRVIIHPTASNTFKTWTAASFVKLARRIQRRGLEPCFVVPPNEAAAWRARVSDIDVAAHATLPELAAYIYESGWFIGNDSGIGHLASALGLPTLSIFPRKGLARRWRPGWGKNRVVLPLPLLVTTALKERCWRPLTPVSRVIAAFDALRADVAATTQSTSAGGPHSPRE